MHLLREAVPEADVREAVELARDLRVGGRDLDALDPDIGMARAQRHGHAALAAAGVEHAPRTHAVHLALELLELGVAPAPIDELLRLSADEHADALLEELEPAPPAQAALLLFPRRHVGLARLEVSEPGKNARRQLRVPGIGMRRLRGLDDLERAVDVLAIELEAGRLGDRVDVVRIHVTLS